MHYRIIGFKDKFIGYYSLCSLEILQEQNIENEIRTFNLTLSLT